MDIVAPQDAAWRAITCCSPSGWDAFGLPTENYAIKNHIHPADRDARRTSPTSQSSSRCSGFGFDWDREIDTTDPNYYKWTQWIFLQLFKHGPGL